MRGLLKHTRYIGWLEPKSKHDECNSLLFDFVNVRRQDGCTAIIRDLPGSSNDEDTNANVLSRTI